MNKITKTKHPKKSKKACVLENPKKLYIAKNEWLFLIIAGFVNTAIKGKIEATPITSTSATTNIDKNTNKAVRRSFLASNVTAFLNIL